MLGAGNSDVSETVLLPAESSQSVKETDTEGDYNIASCLFHRHLLKASCVLGLALSAWSVQINQSPSSLEVYILVEENRQICVCSMSYGAKYYGEKANVGG